MTDIELLDALGSGTALAADLKTLSGDLVDREAVYKWRERERIALPWRPWVIRLARERGVKLPDDIDVARKAA